MKIWFVNCEEAYMGDPNGYCDEAQFGPWQHREDAEHAKTVLESMKLGAAHNHKPLYTRVEISEGYLMGNFERNQVF